MEKLGYSKIIDFKKVLEDGLKTAAANEADGFSYRVGVIGGKDVSIVVEPQDSGIFETVHIDGVEGFGYQLVYED